MKVTIDELVDAFEYKDGCVYNKTSRSSHARVGHRAGGMCPNGYRYVRINGRKISEHRLIYMMFNGDIPNGVQIDHIDGNRINNNIENLRLATNSQNQMNSGIDSKNRTGFKGVSKRKDSNRFQSEIKVDGKGIYLGLYKTAEQAHEAYCNASRKYHGQHGRTV